MEKKGKEEEYSYKRTGSQGREKKRGDREIAGRDRSEGKDNKNKKDRRGQRERKGDGGDRIGERGTVTGGNG